MHFSGNATLYPSQMAGFNQESTPSQLRVDLDLSQWPNKCCFSSAILGGLINSSEDDIAILGVNIADESKQSSAWSTSSKVMATICSATFTLHIHTSQALERLFMSSLSCNKACTHSKMSICQRSNEKSTFLTPTHDTVSQPHGRPIDR